MNNAMIPLPRTCTVAASTATRRGRPLTVKTGVRAGGDTISPPTTTTTGTFTLRGG